MKFVEPPGLEIFKVLQDKILNKMVWIQCWPSFAGKKVLPNLNDSVINDYEQLPLLLCILYLWLMGESLIPALVIFISATCKNKRN